MAVKIINGPQDAAYSSVLTPLQAAFPDVSLDQIESFGRLRLEKRAIGSWYGLTGYQVTNLFSRSDVRAAYDRGRVQVVVAIRQKQLQLALGNDGSDGKAKLDPDVRLLLHAGYHLADQDRTIAPPEPEDFKPTRFSWDAEFKKRLADARAAVTNNPGPQETL